MSKPVRRVSNTARRKSAARLAAVQALYQVEMTGATPDGIVRDVVEGAIGRQTLHTDIDGDSEVELALMEPDIELFSIVVRGTLAQRADIDAMIARTLSRDWSFDRLEAVLRAILRAGTYELWQLPQVPPRVVISEYVDVAHAFYSGAEPGLVNAVLDRIAKVVRAEELGGTDDQPG